MASQSRLPIPAAGSIRAAMSASNGFQRQALDDLIRRELRISDPSDPVQVAKALRERYQGDRRAEAIDQEALGVPYLPAAPAMPALAGGRSSADAEMDQAKDDIERDLAALTQSNLLKDTMAELRGWSDAIRGLVGEGAASAPFALDTRQRDKVFGIRRQLGDYARIARMIGALTPNVNPLYRSLAKSLDEAANVLLVMMGDALANAGYTAGKFLLQVPFSELQVRREAVLAALRNLTGQTGASYLQQTSNEFARGLNAYRFLFRDLDRRGHGDLRVMLLEGELARIMDVLIERAAHGSVDGLRALGATAEVDIDRFRRLARVGNELMLTMPVSPPLVAFNDALELFVESFESTGGARLLRIARPPILFYGLYGTHSVASGEDRLLTLVQARGKIAELADRVLACGCEQLRVRAQVLIDKVIYCLDRAIDLYALCEGDWEDPEVRAAAHGFLAIAVGKGLRFYKKDLGEGLEGLCSEMEKVGLTLIGGWVSSWDAGHASAWGGVGSGGEGGAWGKTASNTQGLIAWTCDEHTIKYDGPPRPFGVFWRGQLPESKPSGNHSTERPGVGAILAAELVGQREREANGFMRVISSIAASPELLSHCATDLKELVEGTRVALGLEDVDVLQSAMVPPMEAVTTKVGDRVGAAIERIGPTSIQTAK